MKTSVKMIPKGYDRKFEATWKEPGPDYGKPITRGVYLTKRGLRRRCTIRFETDAAAQQWLEMKQRQLLQRWQAADASVPPVVPKKKPAKPRRKPKAPKKPARKSTKRPKLFSGRSRRKDLYGN